MKLSKVVKKILKEEGPYHSGKIVPSEKEMEELNPVRFWLKLPEEVARELYGNKYTEPHFADAFEAVATAKKIHLQYNCDVFINTDARLFVKISNKQIKLIPWEHFYEGPPSKGYQQLVSALNSPDRIK